MRSSLARIDVHDIFHLAILLVVLGLLDKTLFLAARGEHYWTTLVIFFLAGDALTEAFVPGAKAVHAALWFWAGVSKLNHHFPSVVGVMTSNNPFIRLGAIRRLMYRSYPDDMRPSQVAVLAGHAGTALEIAVPLVLVTSHGGLQTYVGLALMLGLHGFITSNIPMGVPLEWNVIMVYGGFYLFWKNAAVSVLSMSPLTAAVVLAMCVVLPILCVPRVQRRRPWWSAGARRSPLERALDLVDEHLRAGGIMLADDAKADLLEDAQRRLVPRRGLGPDDPALGLRERPLDAGAEGLGRDALALARLLDAVADVGDAIGARATVKDDATDDLRRSLARDDEAIPPESRRRILDEVLE